MATAILACLHVRYFLRAGALWRDEANTVSLAALGSLGDLWENLQYDSFPLLWHVVLRFWRFVGMGDTDAGLRVLGLIIGLGLASVLWMNSREFDAGAPLVSLSMLGFGAAVIGYGDSLRGYGLGMITGILAYSQIWRVAEAAGPRTVLLALAAALAAVHCLFHNVVVLAASVLAGVVVCVRRKAWKRATAVAGIGLVAGLSMLPYLGPIRQAQDWNATVRAPVTLGFLCRKLFDTLSLSGVPMPWIWLALTLFSIALAVLTQWAPRESEPDGHPADRALYGAVALCAGSAGYAAFLLGLSYPTQPWYYLALLGLAAACIETVLSALPRPGTGSALRTVAGVAVLSVGFLPAWQAAGTRRTNLNLVAAHVERDARKRDVVVVSPWYLGTTFERYYRGAAPWITVPPITFHTYLRYDLLQLEMANPRAMEPLLARLRATLESGGQVFWVGDPPPMSRSGTVSIKGPAAPEGPWVGADGPFYDFWGAQAGDVLRSLSARPERVSVEAGQPVDSYEDARLLVFRTGREAR